MRNSSDYRPRYCWILKGFTACLSPSMIDHIMLALQVSTRLIWTQDVLDKRRHPATDQGLPEVASERIKPEMT